MEKDNNGQTNSSGWGKSSFSFKNSYLDIINKIEVTVSDISGNTKLAGSINLQTTQPKILFIKDPLLGVQNQNALNNDFTVGTNGETIIAIPYFF